MMKPSLISLLISFIFVLSFFGRAFADIPRYQMDCLYIEDTHSLEVNQSVTFTNNQNRPINQVYFHIYANRKFTQKDKDFLLRYAGYFRINPFPDGFQSPDFKINRIHSFGKDLDYKIEGDDRTILKVILPVSLGRGQTTQINLDFSLRIPHAYGRLGWHKQIITLGRWYPILSVLDARGWHNYPYYLFHRPYFSDSGVYKLSITLPVHYQIASTGTKVDQIKNSDNTKTVTIDTELPVRDFALVLSPRFKVSSIEFGNTKINSFYLPGDEFYGKKAAEFARDLMQYYSENFGAYPYKEFNIVPVYLGYAGEEFSNLAFMDTRVYKLPKFLLRYFDFLVAHETGHQWWYNLVGSDEFREMFLVEGVNSYTLLAYLEAKYGKDAKVLVLPKPFSYFFPNFSFRSSRASRYIYMAKNGLDRPVLSKLSSFQEPSGIFALAYGKGSVILDMLAYIVGQDTLDRVLKRYFREFKFKNSSVEDFLDICQQESAQDLAWFFDQWLRTSKQCDYAVRSIDKYKVVLENRGQIQMPLTTEVLLNHGKKLIDNWDGKSRLREIILPEGAKVERVEIDPRGVLLEIDKTNNYYPRRLYNKFVPVYFFAYEIPIFLPTNSYNLVVGPEFAGSGLGMKSSLQKPYDNILYMSSDYDFSGQQINSKLGFRIGHLCGKQNSLGFEFFSKDDLDGKQGDLRGAKLYFRRELWPATYGLSSINDHISVYLVRNSGFSGQATTGNLEDISNLHYYKKQEAIVGLAVAFARYGPAPDPMNGFRLALNQELAGHFLGGKRYFWRQKIDWTKYLALSRNQKIATHLSLGWGGPSSKNLFELGGYKGLRGYDLKQIKGSHQILANLEYRFPLRDDLDIGLWDNLFRIDDISAVLFFDLGKAWFGEFNQKDFKKDAGLGLRFHIDIGSFLERLVIRIDCAQAINEPKQGARLWFGINHAF